ncbi:MAG: DUF423 domain-containing protein [Desulforhopalus sp.]
MITRVFIVFGALAALGGVLARSLSSHALLQILEERGNLANFNLAADYLLAHGLAIIAVALLCQLFPENTYHRAGWFFVFGSLMFQGSVLTKSFMSIHPLGFLTPLGGFLLMAGWGWLLITALLDC